MDTFGSGDFRFRVDETWVKFPASGHDGEAVAVACDESDRVYVFLRGPTPVRIVEPDGRPVGVWGAGQFKRPHGISLNRGNVFCSDDYDHTVRILSPEGTLRRTLGTSGVPSDTGATSTDYRTVRRSGPPFHYPTNVAIAPAGDFFVSDGYGNSRVHHFSAACELLASWGEPGSGPGEFHLPHGIALDAAGNVYVADRENSRIQIFTAAGQYLSEWTDVARPTQIVIERGYAYVAELGFRVARWPGTGDPPPGATGGRVSIFTLDGKLASRWGGGDDPCAAGDFCAPHGICVDSRGSVYVTEVAWTAAAKHGRVPGHCHTLQKFVRV